jgi:hypothetical protein
MEPTEFSDVRGAKKYGDINDMIHDPNAFVILLGALNGVRPSEALHLFSPTTCLLCPPFTTGRPRPASDR